MGILVVSFLLIPLSSVAQRRILDYRISNAADSLGIQSLSAKDIWSYELKQKDNTIHIIDAPVIKIDDSNIDNLLPSTPSSTDQNSEYQQHQYGNFGIAPSSFSILKNKPVGDITCVTSVTEQGAATINIPIAGYNEPQGCQPTICLSYNSYGGNGPIGYGWSIGGLSVITRSSKSVYYDGYADGITSSILSSFTLNGQRLITLKNTSSYIIYQTSVGNIKVIGHISANTVKSFTVLYPNGDKAYFNTTDGNTFYIDKMINRVGRTIIYTYEQTNNHYRIKLISYGMQGEGNISFHYMERNSSNIPVIFNNGIEQKYNYLLADITTKFQNTTIRKYTLFYMTKGLVDLVSKLECSNGTESLNPLYFYYGKDNMLRSYTKQATQLDTWYDFKDTPAQISICKGQFDYGNDNDGIIQFPNKIGYYHGHKNGGLFNHSKDWTTNQFSGDEDILITSGLDQNLTLNSNKIKTGNGFVDIFTANLDKFEGDEIVKINDVKGAIVDTLVFTVYTPSLYSGIAKKYTRRHTFTSLYEDNIIPKYFYCGDFNGDGNNELLIVTSSNFLGKNVESRAIILDLESDKILYDGKPFYYKVNMVGDNCSAQDAFNTSDKLYTIDYNNDGKTEVVIVKDDGTYFYSFSDRNNKWVCNYKGIDTQLTSAIVKDRRVLNGDFNGDGKIDILVSPAKGTETNWNIYAGTGTTSFSLKTIALTNFNDDDTEFYTQDVNQDGQTDLLKKYNSTLYTYFISDFKKMDIQSVVVEEKCHVIPSNVLSGNNWFSLLTMNKEGKITKFRIENSDGKQRLLTGIVNSLGIINTFDYAMLNSEFRNTYSSSYINKEPYKLYKGALYVVSSQKTMYDSKVLHNVTYQYSNAIIHKQGLGFCGFETFRTYDQITGLQTFKTFDPYNFCCLLSSTNNTGKYNYEYDIKVQDNKLANVNLKQKDFTDYTNQVSTKTYYTYDKYGNMLSASANYGDYITSNLTRSYLNIDNDSENTIGLILTEGQSTNRNGASTQKTIKNIYDDQYYLISTMSFVNGNKLSQEDYTYNNDNIIASKKLYKYSSSRATTNSFVYNQYGQVASRTNAFGFKEVLSYNNIGLLNCVENHLGNKENTSYDEWGNITLVSHIDDTKTETKKVWSNGEAGSLFVVTSKETGKPIKKVFYDAEGNIVRTSVQHFDGTYVSVDKVYDSRNRVLKVSYPFKNNQKNWITYTYDDYDRIKDIKYSNQKVDSYSYSGLTTICTSNGVSTKKTYNSIGDLVEVADASGVTTYVYDGNGQPIIITLPKKIVTNISYDAYGRKIKIEDPNAGISTISYDEEGNVNRTTDARNKEIVSTYDEYDRLATRKIEGAGETTYSYDSNGNLSAEIKNDGTKVEYEYDNYERPIFKKETNNDGTWFSKDISYQDGNVSSMTYRSHRGNLAKENYTYSNGTLVNITLSNGKSIFKLEKEDELGRTTEAYSGDILHKTFYDEESRIIGLQAVTNDKTIQDFSYEYDDLTGNLITRIDNKHSLSENFEYDELNRLIKFGDENVKYEENGNIIFSSLIGEYKYSRKKPFAVAGIDNSLNLISDQGQTLEYNALGRVSKISEGKYQAIFTYDSNGNRISMSYVDGDAKKSYTKYYFDNTYELKSGKYIDKEMLYLGGDYYGSNAVLTRTNQGDWDLLFICRDNLGSITVITDENGNIVAEQSYDAWGNLRDPNTWKIYTKKSDFPRLLLNRGYTGHEHLIAFGLINMNARLYSSLLGRFISPDPLIQFSDNSQNFNRYTYCLNNPFCGVDVSGKSLSLLAIIGIGAAVGAVVNVGSKAIAGQIHSFGDFFAAAGVGACAGAISSIAVIAVGIPAVGIMGGMATGAIAGFTGSIVTDIGNNAFFGDSFGFKDLAMGTVMGCVLGGATGGITAKIQGRNIWTGELKNAVIEPQVSNLPETTGQDAQAPKASQGSNAEIPTTDITPSGKLQEASITENSQKVDYKIIHQPEQNRNFSPERKALEFKRPTIKGYADRVKPGSPVGGGPTDLGHNFPGYFDKQIVKYGIPWPVQPNGGQTFALPGSINKTTGWFTITINQNGIIYHRCFETNINAIK